MLHYMNPTLFFHFDCFQVPIQQSILLFLIFHVLVACSKSKHLHLIHKNFENHYIHFSRIFYLPDKIQVLSNYNMKRILFVLMLFEFLVNQHYLMSFAFASPFFCFANAFNSSTVKSLYGFFGIMF